MECSEVKIPLLSNTAALCWFDSGNFALFHKRRPELDTFFSTPDNLKEGWNIVQELYDHFSGKNTEGVLREKMNQFRSNPDLQNFFNQTGKSKLYRVKETFLKKPVLRKKLLPKESEWMKEEFNDSTSPTLQIMKEKEYELKKEGEKQYIEFVQEDWTYQIRIEKDELEKYFEGIGNIRGFQIQNDDVQDTADYINGFLNKGMFNTLSIPNQPSFFLPERKDYLKILDFEQGKTKLQITEKTFTVVVDTRLDPKGKSSEDQNYTEILTLPLTNGTMVDFKLDAVIVYTGASHYFVVVRCGETEDWVTYNDLELKDGETIQERIVAGKQQKEKLFSRFPIQSINRTAKLLFYSRPQV